MKRFVFGLALACPILVVGVVSVGLAAWLLVSLGLNVLVTPWLVVGLSACVPLCIVAADRLVPGQPTGLWSTVTCPDCGGLVPVGFASKPVSMPEV